MEQKNSQIFIAKLGFDTNENDMRRTFEKFGSIREIILKKSYGFVNYENQDSALEAIKAMNGQKINGRRVVVEMSEDRGGRRNDRRPRDDDRRGGDRDRRGDRRDGDRMGNRGPTLRDSCYNCGREGHWLVN